jgi:predicted restriction endonuclease
MTLNYFIRYLSSKKPEMQRLRNHLIKKYNNDILGNHCSMCLKNYPLSLLDTAHLKPRYTLEGNELHELNNVEFMCKICHNLYDRGSISIDNKYNIVAHQCLLKYNHLTIHANIGNIYSKVNNHNLIYLGWHYNNIFKKV